MKSIYRSFAVGVSAAALSMACSFAWALPSAITAPAASTPASAMQDQGKAQTFSGTIVKAGDAYVLRDSSGATYRLDDSAKAAQFEGKQVKVTGTLDSETKTIHVQSIEGGA